MTQTAQPALGSPHPTCSAVPGREWSSLWCRQPRSTLCLLSCLQSSRSHPYLVSAQATSQSPQSPPAAQNKNTADLLENLKVQLWLLWNNNPSGRAGGKTRILPLLQRGSWSPCSPSGATGGQDGVPVLAPLPLSWVILGKSLPLSSRRVLICKVQKHTCPIRAWGKLIE